MALQLGFDGNLQLTRDSDDESIRTCLAMTRDKYAAYAKAIDSGESERAIYWRIQFAILSVHSPIDATFEAYKALRLFRARFQRVPSEQVLTSLLANARGSDGVVLYAHSKATYIRQFDADWRADKSAFLRNGESDSDWRFRLQRNIKGLGLAKASFAVALSAPSTSDVCCIDTHIHALLTGKTPTKSIGKKVYLALEERIRALALEFGLSTFATQWALWDARRGVSNSHSALAFE